MPKYIRILACCMFVASSNVSADGLMVVGLVPATMEWKLFIQAANEEWLIVPTEDEPRTPVRHGASSQILYADSLGNIRHISAEGNESVVFNASANATFTQPEFGEQATQAYVVSLKNGASVDTDILIGDLKTGSLDAVVRQRSAQFEPFSTPDGLYYSSVSCVPPACHRIIEDIWRINPVTSEAHQLTSTNAISREPVVDYARSTLYFISDKGGQFQLYHHSDGEATPITSSNGPVSSPAINSAGDIFYIQRSKSHTDQLFRWSGKTSTLSEVPGPTGVTKLRDLSVWLSD